MSSSGLGIGCYQGATFRHRGAGLYLTHLCPDVARQTRQDEPDAYIIGRFDDGDASGVRLGTGEPLPEASAFWFSHIAPVLHSHPGVYNLVLGLCELWPKSGDTAGLTWRASFELALCRLVKATGYRYGFGSIPTGNLEPDELHLFADVIRESECVVYHAYLKPGRLNVAEDTEPYWALRPTRMWAPELKQLGLPSRFLYTEVGPFTADVHGETLARLEVAVAALVRDDCKQTGATFLGALAYGSGMLGSEQPWELRDSEQIIIDARPRFELAAPPPAPAPTPPKGATHVTDYSSPNKSGPRASTTGIVVHSTRGGSANLESEFDATVNWFYNAAAGVSAHAVVSPTRTALPVRSELTAWHCRTRNATALGIEFCQPRSGDVIPDSELQRGALVCAGWCLQYKIPTVWALNGGFAQHKDTPEGQADGKSDVGTGFNGDRFIVMVKERVAELTKPPVAKVDPITSALDGAWYFATLSEGAPNVEVARHNATLVKEKIVALKQAIGR